MVKNLPAEAGDGGAVGLIPGSGRSPGEGNGNPLHILAQRTRGACGIWSTRTEELVGYGPHGGKESTTA